MQPRHHVTDIGTQRLRLILLLENWRTNMRKFKSIATVNDVLHAVAIAAVLAVSAIGVSDELFSLGDEAQLGMAVRVASAVSVAIGTPFVQPSRSYFDLKSS
jgi:hypothetical protein